jgi:hypothetical protein
MLTKSRRHSKALEHLAPGRSRMMVICVERFGGLGLKTTGGWFSGLGLKLGRGSGGNRRRHMASARDLRRGETKSRRTHGRRISSHLSWAIIPLGLGGSL